MAKLSAHGRREIYRIEYRSDRELADMRTPRKACLMSDHTILKNDGWGWKVAGKLRDDVNPETWLANRLAQGWTKTELQRR